MWTDVRACCSSTTTTRRATSGRRATGTHFVAVRAAQADRYLRFMKDAPGATSTFTRFSRVRNPPPRTCPVPGSHPGTIADLASPSPQEVRWHFVRPWLPRSSRSQRVVVGPGPAGGEFLVNAYTTGTQTTRLSLRTPAATSCDLVGGFQRSGDSSGIFGQRYDASGARPGGEFG